jgi:uncharacterized membrane protein
MLAALLVVIGLVLRFGFLGMDSFWLDEVNSVWLVLHHSAADLWTRNVDGHPPLFYVILRETLSLTGVSEFAARLPSAVASALNLSLIFVLARRLHVRRRFALAATVLLALAPIDIWYAQEARMYALVTTAGLLFAIGLAMDSWSGALIAAGALTVGLHLEFTMVPLSLALTSVWLVRWWHTGRSVSRASQMVLASAVGWWLFRPWWGHLIQTVTRIDQFTLFSHVSGLAHGLRLGGSVIMTVFVSILVAITIGTAAVWRALGNARFRHWWGWMVWSGFTIATAGLTVPRAYSAKQVIVTGWPFVVLVAAWALTDNEMDNRSRSEARVVQLRLPVATAVSLVAAIVAVATPRADWRGAVAYLNQHASDEANVWLDPLWNDLPYNYYRPIMPPTRAVPDAVEASRAGLVWMVAERTGRPHPTSPSEAWLDGHLRLVEVVPFARLELRRYQR